MIALKGKSDIGEQISKKILKPLFAANELEGFMELVDKLLINLPKDKKE
jgi:type I restriction enzyme M protein